LRKEDPEDEEDELELELLPDENEELLGELLIPELLPEE